MSFIKTKEICVICRTYTGKKEHRSYKCYTPECPVWEESKGYKKKRYNLDTIGLPEVDPSTLNRLNRS